LATTKTVRLENFADEIRKTNKVRLEDYQASVVHGVIKSVPDLIESSPVDTGEYAASWDFTADEQSAILGNYAPHAPIIERGARPFTPPLQPLLAWAKRVLQDPSQPPDYSREVWALAQGTQQKIAREGMKPRNILEQAIPGIIANIKEELAKRGG
jgi:hypothetical protein